MGRCQQARRLYLDLSSPSQSSRRAASAVIPLIRRRVTAPVVPTAAGRGAGVAPAGGGGRGRRTDCSAVPISGTARSRRPLLLVRHRWSQLLSWIPPRRSGADRRGGRGTTTLRRALRNSRTRDIRCRRARRQRLAGEVAMLVRCECILWVERPVTCGQREDMVNTPDWLRGRRTSYYLVQTEVTNRADGDGGG